MVGVRSGMRVFTQSVVRARVIYTFTAKIIIEKHTDTKGSPSDLISV